MFIVRNTCGVCGSAKKELLWSEAFQSPSVWGYINDHYLGRVPQDQFLGHKYELVKCLDCGFIWQASVLKPEDMGRLYEQWIEPLGSLRRKQEADVLLFSGYASEVQCISSLLHKKPSEISVFDFGMGWGSWCLMAKAFGYQVSGFEVSPERIAHARSVGIDVLEYTQIKKRKFDFINADMVFEHLSEPRQTLEMLANTLNRNGIIRIAIPDGRKLEKKLRNKTWKPGMLHVDPLEHISSYTKPVFGKMAELVGLKPIKQPLLMPREPGTLAFLRTIAAKYKKEYIGSPFYLTAQ